MKILIRAILILIVSISSHSYAVASQTTNEVIEKTQKSEAPLYSESASSEDLAQEFLNEVGLTEGDNDGLFVAVGTAVLPEPDPASNPDFLTMRRIKASEASLEAKRQFIEFIRTTMSAEDVITMPESPFSTEFDNKMKATQNKINKAFRKYKLALRKANKAEAAKFNGIDFSVLAKEGITATIKRINPEFDASKVEKKLADDLAKAKADLEATETDLNNLKNELETLRGSLQQENVSSIETFSKMNVVGLVPIASFESWDGEQYATTIVSIWTTKEEERARLLYSGQDVAYDPGSSSVKDFINSTDWSTAQGVRKFFDDKGNFWLISIGSSPLKGKSSKATRTAKGQAQLSAQKQIAFVLFSEASSKRSAKEKLQEVTTGNVGETENQSVTSFAETISQKVEDLDIQGMSQLKGKKYTHPISGQEMFVSIYGISSKAVRQAQLMEASQARVTQDMIRENQRSKGVKAGFDKAIDDAKKDKSSFQKGFKEGQAKAKSQSNASKKSSSSSPKSGGSSKGGFKGAGTGSSAFK
ncbi:MAG: hypothetical protein CM15mP114_15240 [Alphaproteobacteria bacterium]|nr:MAG: hypothetical protein CM15mP114_15240 [Alphaproteobacteria bacterium]